MFGGKPTQSAPSLRRKNKRKGGRSFLGSGEFRLVCIVCGIMLLAMSGFWWEFSKYQQETSPENLRRVQQKEQEAHAAFDAVADFDSGDSNSDSREGHLFPRVPVLPIFPEIKDSDKYMQETINGTPTMAGVIAILQGFLKEFHTANNYFHALKEQHHPAQESEVTSKFFELTAKYLQPFDQAYRGRPIFPIREDGSIFLSLAAYREHLLGDTLEFAFSHAKNPDKLFVGAVVQNCFGKVLEDGTIDTSGMPCRTGMQVVGKNAQGKDQTKVSEAPPDKNGIEDFCSKPDFQKYCENGQIRVLYVHETESQGPAMARYYASKLWGGENYFVQCDSHLQFADHWDAKYIDEVKLTTNYPKSVLSSYPPGFSSGVKESPGARLCSCETKVEDPNPIIRINVGMGYRGNEPRPTQIPFIAAGFFFAHSSFLTEIPFDPYIPWCFMGEEIALSMRAWTHGWDIYAPRKNLIAHQYRPGRMGLPKFWETANRL